MGYIYLGMAGVWFRVEGRVQGVGFRAYVQGWAQEIGVTGEVWNTRDHAVEIEAFGDVESLATFASGILNGPGYIERVNRQELPTRNSVPDAFEIGRTR